MCLWLLLMCFSVKVKSINHLIKSLNLISRLFVLRNKFPRTAVNGAPTLIIEVLSPSTALKDFNEKFNLYQKHGVQEYWIVDPGNRTVHVYTLQDGSYQVRHLYTEQETIQSIVFKDLQVPMNTLFSL